MEINIYIFYFTILFLFGLKARSSHGGPAYNSSKINNTSKRTFLGISITTGNQNFCLFHGLHLKVHFILLCWTLHTFTSAIFIIAINIIAIWKKVQI